MNSKLWLSILILISCLSANASDFDQSNDYCFALPNAEKDARSLKINVLDGPNFVLTPNKEYAINCSKRIIAILTLENANSSDENLDKAIKTLGYQSTFSDRAALALISYLERGAILRKPMTESQVDWGQIDYFDDGFSLAEKAAQAFYFLHDHFPTIEPFLAFYGNSKNQERFRRLLIKESNGIITSHFAQVWQKVGFYFQLKFSAFSKLEQTGVSAVIKNYSLILIETLNSHMDNTNQFHYTVRNEALVALGYMSKLEIFKDENILRRLSQWYLKEYDIYLRNRALSEIAPLRKYLETNTNANSRAEITSRIRINT